MELVCIAIVQQPVLAVVNWCVPQCLEYTSSQLRDFLIRLRCWAGCFEGVEHQFIDYLSVNSIEDTKNSVYAALENKSVIGLWGMGGVGKTSLMRKINNEMEQRGNIFVIWVSVSHNDIKTTQNNIARRLCSSKQFEKFKTKDDIHVRANIISNQLKKFKSVIIFDDVWEDLNFTEIGIDINDENLRCKIVLTSRAQDICQRLGAEQIEMYAGLDETESWKFFQKYSVIDKNPNRLRIEHIAQEICRKCAGLPLAISVVAKSLCREKLESKWNRCLESLNEGCPERVSSYVKNVYVPLKFSYERLEEDDLKMGFLLCSVFAQGQEIQLRDFICYDIGVDKCVKKYRGQRSLNTYRDIFINLKRKGLLQDVVEKREDEKENSARMHDVIRDVAISLAQNEFKGFFKIEKFIKWNSSIQNLNSTDRLQNNINEVQFLSFNGDNILESIHPDFFEGMENLLFLDLRGTSISIKEFIETCLQKLAKLRVLMFKILHQNITDIAVDITNFFFLQHLSVLCLQNVHISELNQEFSKKLIHLRSIDFSNTLIDIIRPKVFSSLRNTLEELNMQGSYSKWKAYNQEDGDYVAFEEMEDLKNLYSLHIDIDDKTIFSREYAPSLVIPPVEYFSIRSTGNHNQQRVWSSTILILSRIQLSNVAKWLQVLFEKIKALCMNDFEIDNNCAAQAISSVIEQDIVKLLCNLKSLDVGNSSKQKNLIQYNTQGDPILPKLEHINMIEMVGIQNIFVNTEIQTIIPAKSFERLGRIIIYRCDRLKFIFPWNVAECVVCLEKLEIFYCSQLENIIEKNDQGVSGSKARTLFPKLRFIKLNYIPNLENIWKQECYEKSEMEWHSLKYLDVWDCEKLNWLFMGVNSAPDLHSMNCSKEWFNKLLWEDKQAESRFNGVWNDLMTSKKKAKRRMLFLFTKREIELFED